jgi:hypothetical protein
MDDKAVTGVCLVKEGGGAGTWARVDEYGQPMSLPGNYFDYHPVYAGMVRTTVAGQEMVKIPAFFVKRFAAHSGPFSGQPCWVISPGPREGFHLHPAFKNTAGDLDCFYLGSYLATDNGDGSYGSRPAKSPVVNISHSNMKTRFEAMNTGGATGFHMMRFYEWAVLEWLFLVEFCTPDAQSIWSTGLDTPITNPVDDPASPVWRNLWRLWGITAQRLDGLARQDNTLRLQLEANDGSGAVVTTDYVPVTYASVGSKLVYPVSMHTGRGDRYDFGDVFFPDTFSAAVADATFPDAYMGLSASANFGPFVGRGTASPPYDAGMFTMNISNSITALYATVSSRLAKYGEPVTFAEPAAAPKANLVMDRPTNTATLFRPGNVLRAPNPVGALRIDIPPHTGAQTTMMLIHLEILGNVGYATAILYIPCQQSLTVWPGENLLGVRVGSPYEYYSIRTAKTPEGRACLILGEVTDEPQEELEDITDPFVYFNIREITLIDPEASYLDPDNWRLSLITDDSDLTYADDDINLM